MRVDIKIDPQITETNVIIQAPKISTELIALAELLEKADDKAYLLTAKKDDKLFIIEAEQVDIVRTEGGEVKLYKDDATEYTLAKPLTEIHERLGENFLRISKSALVHINRVDHIAPSFNGTMYIVMKNGISDYISRKYLSAFKKHLGL